MKEKVEKLLNEVFIERMRERKRTGRSKLISEGIQSINRIEKRLMKKFSEENRGFQ